jgi:hypothetical protein
MRIITTVFLLGILFAQVVFAEPEEEARSLLPDDAPLFVSIRLPHGISIELPRSWRVVAGDVEQDLNALEATLDLTHIPAPANQTLLRGTATLADLPAAMTIAYLPRSAFPLSQASEASPAALADYDRGLRDSVESQLRERGITLLDWRGTYQDRLDGHFTLVSEYVRKSGPASAVREQVNMIQVSDAAVLLSVAYKEDAGDFWRSVVMRIRSSCRIAAAKNS